MSRETARAQFAVLGSPISHSKSPALHRAAYAVLGFDADYSSVDVPADGLDAFLDSLDASWRGLSLTMPLKEQVLARLSGADGVVRQTGAANTVVFTPDGITGFNTDVTGIVDAFADVGVDHCDSMVVLGAGATARSAISAGAALGAGNITIAARTPARAATAVRQAESLGIGVTVVSLAAALAPAATPDDERADSQAHPTSGIQVWVSTLPGGSLTEADVSCLTLPMQSGAVPPALLDVAYAPWPSVLGAAWARRGGVVVPGIRMLVHQALVQVRIFVTGDPHRELPDEAAVLRAMFAAVDIH